MSTSEDKPKRQRRRKPAKPEPAPAPEVGGAQAEVEADDEATRPASAADEAPAEVATEPVAEEQPPKRKSSPKPAAPKPAPTRRRARKEQPVGPPPVARHQGRMRRRDMIRPVRPQKSGGDATATVRIGVLLLLGAIALAAFVGHSSAAGASQNGTNIVIDGAAHGPAFQGIGAISGGGGYIASKVITEDLGLKPWWKPVNARRALERLAGSTAGV